MKKNKKFRILREYQALGLKYCLQKKNPVLFMQMRLGKTIITIRSIKIRIKNLFAKNIKILVVAPYSALYSWENELLLEGENNFIKLYESREMKLKELKNNYSCGKWFLFNKEGHRILPEISDYYFNIVIIDESTFIKDPKSKVTKFYINNFRNAQHRYILTGTPAPESELNYFCQLRFIDHDIWQEQNFYEFKYKHFENIGYENLIKPESSKYIENTIAKHCYFLSRDDINLGGKKIYEKRFVKLPFSVVKIYEKIEKEFALEYQEIKQDTIYATTKYMWLRHLCGGFIESKLVSDVKIKEIYNLLKGELKKEQLIIYANFIDEVKFITEYLRKKNFKTAMIYGDTPKKKRPEIYKNFQNKKIDILIAQPETIKYGSNLSAADTIIYYSTPIGGDTREQSEERMIDIMKNKSCLIIDIICKDTIEEDILKSVKMKEKIYLTMKRSIQRLQEKYARYSR